MNTTSRSRGSVWRIGDLAHRLGVPTSTLRFWERQGLLGGRVARGRQGYREYGEGDLESLRRVLALREAGLELARIRELLHEGGECRDLVEEIDAQVSSLEEARAAIQVRLEALSAARAACAGGCAPAAPACDCLAANPSSA